MPSTALRLYGTDEAAAPVRALRAGPLSLELQGARLRHIRCGAHEIWHGLALVLRDADWGTPEPILETADVRAWADSFEAHLTGHWTAPARVDFELHIRGGTDGSIRFDAQALPQAELQLNRLGLCLLHPLAVCGARVQITHVDGRISDSGFPQLIPPWPPFMLVRALRHRWAPGHWAQATLEGDCFETEDQRNNGDASFKTYSRSNLAPRPYRMEAGQAVRQSALLRVELPARTASKPQTRRRPAPPLRVAVGGVTGDWLPVGVEIHANDAGEPALLPLLRDLQPAHLHLAWRPGDAVHWPGIAAMLGAGGAHLRLDLLLPDEPGADRAVPALKADLDAAGIAAEGVAVFAGHAAPIEAARRHFAPAAVGGGTPHFFVQLSRLDALAAVDFASFTTSSIVHGADDDEVMLGLASLPDMVATWRARHPALPLRIGPNAIAARASPLGAQPASDGTRRLALAAADPRSSAQFGAAWALGHVVGLAQDGVQALTLLALRGPNGVVSAQGSGWQRHPAFEPLALLGRPAQRLSATVSQPRRLAALALQRGGRPLLLIGNLGPQPIDVEITGLPGVRPGHRLEAFAVALIEAGAG